MLSVKGSGADLSTIGRGGFTTLRLADLALLQARDEMSDEEMMAFMRACMLDGREPAPSVETPLHALLPHRCIVHTHDFATQALTDTPRPEALVREVFGGDVAYVDYVRPGFPLARALARHGALEAPRGLVLARHGLVAWGDTPRACYDNLHHLINVAEAYVGAKAAPRGGVTRGAGAREANSDEQRQARARALLPVLRRGVSTTRPAILHLDDSPEALAFVGSEVARKVHARGMVTPEHILRCGRVPLFVDADLGALPLAEATGALKASLDVYANAGARDGSRATRIAGEMLPPVPRVALLPGAGRRRR